MKKIKFTGKLGLNKETVSKLNEEQLNQVKGGDALSYNTHYCNTSYCETILTAQCATTPIKGC